MGMHPKRDAGDTAPNRERKHDRVRTGTAHAALVFDGVECLGWCQFGSPDEVSRIKNRAADEKARAELPDWRIGCCYVGKGHCREGVSATALAGALVLIAGPGGGTVEGYPEPAGAVSAGFLYHGALSTFEALGFARDRKLGKHRWVVMTRVSPNLGEAGKELITRRAARRSIISAKAVRRVLWCVPLEVMYVDRTRVQRG